MVNENVNHKSIHRLTALWALSESGLGGIMHALKIPFTGFILGGFAVLIIALLAHFSKNNFKVIIQATGLVLLIKAGVSPQSPLPAYVAVGFQGLVGGMLFALLPNYKTASILFGAFALVESAIQQLLIATVLFGKSIWVAIDLFVQGVLKDFHLSPDFSFSTWLVVFYLVVYAAWGIYLGFYAAHLPDRLDIRAIAIENKYRSMTKTNETIAPSKQKQKNGFVFILLVLAFIATVFYFEGRLDKVYEVILRTIAIILFVFLILRPVVSYFFRKANKGKEAHVNRILTQLPELGSFVKPAFLIAGEHKKGVAKYREFVFVLIVLSLMGHTGSD
jgi:hypothetical protein